MLIAAEKTAENVRGFIVINEADFNADIHKIYVAAKETAAEAKARIAAETLAAEQATAAAAEVVADDAAKVAAGWGAPPSA